MMDKMECAVLSWNCYEYHNVTVERAQRILDVMGLSYYLDIDEPVMA